MRKPGVAALGLFSLASFEYAQPRSYRAGSWSGRMSSTTPDIPIPPSGDMRKDMSAITSCNTTAQTAWRMPGWTAINSSSNCGGIRPRAFCPPPSTTSITERAPGPQYGF
jgi:hypothetical protein